MPTATQTTNEDDAATHSWLSVIHAYHLCSELMFARLAEMGVKTSEHEILANLQRQPGINQQTLAARCFTAKSHVSGLLNDMASKGWISRQADPTDGRAKRLTLTTAGAEMAIRTLQIQAEVVALMTEDVTPIELQLITEVMTGVSARLEAALRLELPEH